MTDNFRRAPHQEHRVPELPRPDVGTCRLALLVAQSDLAEARYLAPDAETREEIDSVVAQINKISDDLYEQLPDESDGDTDDEEVSD